MNNINKAIIPVAGKGTRFLPVTKCVNKIMFPIINKPAIHYLVEECINAGINEIIFVINSLQYDVVDYFNLKSEYYKNLSKPQSELDELSKLIKKVKLHFVIQDEPKGLGDAILRCEEIIGNENFALLLGDELVMNENNSFYGIGDLVRLYKSIKVNNKSLIGVREIKEEDTSKYGIISITDLFSEEKVVKVNDMIEKPNCNPPSNIASVGRYILDNNMFKYLHELSKKIIFPKELGITEAIKIACKMDNVYAYSFHGKRFDIGDHAGYVEANIAFSLKDEKINHEILDYIKEVTTNEDD